MLHQSPGNCGTRNVAHGGGVCRRKGPPWYALLVKTMDGGSFSVEGHNRMHRARVSSFPPYAKPSARWSAPPNPLRGCAGAIELRVFFRKFFVVSADMTHKCTEACNLLLQSVCKRNYQFRRQASF
jgi:hypothetical protein